MTHRPEPAAHAGPSDEQLLARIAVQDAEALAELFHRYGSRVLAYVRAMAPGAFPHEDAVQEIFLALWQKAGLFAPQEDGGAAGWIFTVTRHKVFDIQRSLGRVRETGGLDLEFLGGAHGEGDPTLAPSIHKALAMLPDDQLTPLRLAYFGDLSYDETARMLGLPVGTVKTRIRAGLRALRGLVLGREKP
ncbi:RNA polymerase sigma factor [Mesoterricola sediminis]|uniref:RNA polymerase sigma factor n=1 Tax=Mesoterricola sediminis TaxID=2927980 RepID=A0AA48KER8_9BACT|nr:RNA polymerase sigma factor [Mesoterricola sediminis]BDU77557.1 RNA polymerase sigma factor [Mesoterricola sediminis]